MAMDKSTEGKPIFETGNTNRKIMIQESSNLSKQMIKDNGFINKGTCLFRKSRLELGCEVV